MKKVLRYFLLTALLAFAFCLGGCGTTLTTDMEMSSNFAGVRKMDVKVDMKTLDEKRLEKYAPGNDFSGVIENIGQAMPESMGMSYEEVREGTYIFHFVLPFTSKEDYITKVQKILGYDIMCEFSCTVTPFSESIDLQENFTSKELLKWLPDYLEEQGYITNDESRQMFKTADNYVTINGEKNTISTNYMKLQKRSYTEIEMINIFTDIDAKEAKIARKIELVFQKSILDQKSQEIEKYLSSVTPKNCMSEWQTTDDKKEKFVLLIPPCTTDEMEGAMRTFCASEESSVQLVIAGETFGTDDAVDLSEEKQTEIKKEQTTSYSDMWDQAVLGDLNTQNTSKQKDYVQPFSYEIMIDEQLDLRNFICNSWGEIDTAYYISVKNGKPESMLYYPNGEEIYGWDYISEDYPEYYYVEDEWRPVYQVVSKVDKAYVPVSTDMTTKVKSENNVTREFVFRFDEPFEELVLKHISTHMENLFSEHKKILSYEIHNKKNSAEITLKFKGSVANVNALCESIFGQGYSSIRYTCQDNQDVTKQYNFSESIDLGKIFDWKYTGNIDYTAKLPGKIDKTYTNISGGVNSKMNINGKNVNYVSTESGYVSAYVLGTQTNAITVFWIILIIFIILAVVAGVVFFILRLVKNDKEES